MNPIIFALIAIFCYLGNTFLLIKPIQQCLSQRTTLFPAWFAVSFQGIYIGSLVAENNGFNFSFFSMATLVSMIVAFILLIASLNKPVEKLGIGVFPIVSLMLVFDVLFANNIKILTTYSVEMNTHILSSIIAFSLLNIAAFQAILLFIQNQQLKSHPPKPFILALPALQTMESLLFQMLGTGLFFLTLSLISGFIFLDDLFAQHLAHKTILSLCAWFIFSVLLIGKWRYGWRGLIAVKWTLLGFVLLLLSYFGSKLVLELILHR